MDIVNRYGRQLLFALIVLALGYAIHSYRHFEWLTVKDPAGASFAIPAFRK